MSEIIRTEDLSRSFQELEPVQNVNISVNSGEFVTLLGRSGSGKSTLLGLLGGLDRPTSGRVFLADNDLNELNEDELALLRRRNVGFVFQAFHLIPTLPAVENVAFPLYPERISSGDRKSRATALLRKMGLENRAHHLPSKLSGGERQRVAIARALINNPKLIFCDEPTGNLDSKTGNEIIDLLVQLNKENSVSLFMVTHDEAIAEKSDRSFIMKDGEVKES